MRNKMSSTHRIHQMLIGRIGKDGIALLMLGVSRQITNS